MNATIWKVLYDGLSVAADVKVCYKWYHIHFLIPRKKQGKIFSGIVL